MKRGAILFLAVVLSVALAVPAWAGGLAAGPEPVYLGADGQVMDPEGKVLLKGPVDKLIFHGGRVLVYQQDDTLLAQRSGSAQRSLGLMACDAVWCEGDGYVYYVRTSQPDTLMRLDPETLATSTACKALKPIEYLRLSMNGVLAEVDGAEYLYVPSLKKLAGPDETVSGQMLSFNERYEARLDGAGRLTVLENGENEPEEVALNVMCAAIADNIIYYLEAWGANARLMAYTIDAGTSARLYRFDEPMWDQIAVLGGEVLLVSKAGTLQKYQLLEGRLLTGDQLGKSLEPMFETAGQMVVLYDLSAGSHDAYMLGVSKDAPGATPTPSPTPHPTPTPNPYPTLSRGARGDAVKRLQERLKELGYLAGSADGIYGAATQTAVTYLQFDMGLKQTGTADASLQKKVLHGDPPTYSTYVTLDRGDSGIRVRDLQERLRQLYYTKEAVDGYYGSNTADAVERFQAQKGYKEHGDRITVREQRALFKSGASKCNQYYTLRRGDEAPVVKALNQRLKKLGYLTGSAGESYGRNTEKAVKAFQENSGLNETGVADPRTQRLLYGGDAPTPTPTPVPTPKPDSAQAVKNSVIKTMRSWMNNNLNEKYDKEGAVEQLQVQLVSLGYLDKGQINGVYNEKTVAAVKAFQRDNGLSASGNANKQTLKKLFEG